MMTIRALRENEKDEMYDLLDRSYAKQNREFFKQRTENDPSFSLELNRVLEVDGALVARIGIHDRKMYFQGEALRVGAIGGVCTDPAHRGKGYVKMLLEDCTQWMKKSGFDLSLLFGEPAIYGGSGWQTLASFGMQTNFRIHKQNRARLIPVTEIEKSSDTLAKIYDQFNARLNGPFLRSKSYWNMWIKTRLAAGKDNLFVYPDAGAGAPGGYYVAKGTNTITEIAYGGKDGTVLTKMMESIFGNANPEEGIVFNFFLQEIFEHVSRMSVAPSLEEIRKQEYQVKKTAIYSGLFKLISNTNKTLQNARNTPELLELLRNNNYNFWGFDHF